MARKSSPQKPSTSKALRRLLLLATRDGVNVQILLRMLIALNIPPTLAGAVQAFRRVKSLLPSLITIAPEPIASELPKWLSILVWFNKNSRRIARYVYWGYAKRTRATSAFSRTEGPNPLNGEGSTRFALTRMLFDSEIDDCRSGLAFLEIYVTAAHIIVITATVDTKRWWYGDEPENTFVHALYRPCKRCWDFRREGTWHEISSRIQKLSSLEEAQRQIQLLANSDDAVVQSSTANERTTATPRQALQAIAWMIEWSLDPKCDRISRKRNGAPSDEECYNQPISGDQNGENQQSPILPTDGLTDHEVVAVSSGQSGEIQIIACDEDDPSSDRVTVRVEWKQDEHRFKELQHIGDHPGEELASETMHLADSEYGRALSYSGNTEVAVQRLPYGYEDLATYEIARFLEDIPKCLDANEAAILHAFVLLTLLTGAPKHTIGTMMLRKLPVSTLPAQSAVLISEESSYFVVECDHVHIKPENYPPKELARQTTDTFILSVAAHAPLVEALSALPSNTSFSSWISSSTPHPRVAFHVGIDWLEERVSYINERQNYPRKVTLDKLRRVLPRVLTQITAGDFVIVSNVTSEEDYLASIAHHYATLGSEFLNGLYVKATKELSRRLAQVGYDLPCLENPTSLDRLAAFVGSPLFPETIPLRDALASLRELIGSPSLQDLTLEQFVQIHNRLVSYGILCYSLTALGRGTTLYIDFSEIDYANRLASIWDKSDKARSKARPVLFIDRAYKQSAAIHSYLTRLSAEHCFGLKLPRPSRAIPGYFLKPDGSWYRITPSTFEELLDHVFNFGALNFGRHYVATRARELSLLNFESLSGALGHARAGQEIYGRFNSMHPRVWRAKLDKALNALFDELGVEVVDPKHWFR